MKVVIGDIHGCFDELMELLSVIGVSKSDEIISLGDIVDRGPASDKVVDFFMRAENSKVLMGNHERKHYRHSIGRSPIGKSQLLAIEQFKRAGMDYGKILEFFKNLPLYMELPEAVLVHAGLMYGIPLEKQYEKILTGAGFQKENEIGDSGLPRWCESYPVEAKPVIFGHLSLRVSMPYRNLWPLDTGCCRGGFLTAVTLPDWQVWRVKARKDYWGEIKYKK